MSLTLNDLPGADDDLPEGKGIAKANVHGIPCVIEYRKGDFRPSAPAPGEPRYAVYADYGYIENSISTEEGDEKDVFLGPTPESTKVYVAQLLNPGDPASLMEEKVLLQFEDYQAAKTFINYQYDTCMVMQVYEIGLQDFLDVLSQEKTKAAALVVYEADQDNNQLKGEADDENKARRSGMVGDLTQTFEVVSATNL